MPDVLIVKFQDQRNILGTRAQVMESFVGRGGAVIDRKNNQMIVEIADLDDDKIRAVRRQIEQWSGEIVEEK